MKSLLLGLVLAMSVVLPAAAENWVYIGANENDTTLSIDVESIIEINQGYAYKQLIVNKRLDKYILGYSQMLCKKRVSRLAGYESYDVSGQLIQERRFPGSPFDKILVNSLEAALWEKLCNYKKLGANQLALNPGLHFLN